MTSKAEPWPITKTAVRSASLLYDMRHLSIRGKKAVATMKIRAEINDVKHRAGILSMARGEELDSALTSFFIVLADQPALDGTYTVFGRVVEGMDVVEKIAAVPTENERPKELVEIYSMKAERRK